MPGTLTEATKAIEVNEELNCGVQIEGWLLAGQGGSRRAWLSPSGIVYKVLTDDDYANTQSWAEVDNVKFAQQAGPIEGWDVADAELFIVGEQPVVAMEYIESDGTSGTHYNNYPQVMEKWNISDIWMANLVIRNGVHVIVDAGLSSSDY